MSYIFQRSKFFTNVKKRNFYTLDPFILPHFQVDRGAVKFLLSGADVMCPGLTSEGGKVDLKVEKNKMVAIMVEGKTHAIAVGKTLMSAKEM
jgi:malignant T-cell-amplified sequence